jgi:hypothetical protein
MPSSAETVGGICLARAQEAIHQVCHDLSHRAEPSGESAARLAEALVWLGRIPGALAEAPADSRASLRIAASSIRQELALVRSLLDSAAGFYAGWSRLRAALAAGYTAGGVPAEVPSPHRLSLAG